MKKEGIVTVVKTRVHLLAKELGIDPKDLVAHLEKMGIKGKKSQSSLEDEEAARIRAALVAPAKPQVTVGEEKVVAENVVGRRVRANVIRRRTSRVEVISQGAPAKMEPKEEPSPEIPLEVSPPDEVVSEPELSREETPPAEAKVAETVPVPPSGEPEVRREPVEEKTAPIPGEGPRAAKVLGRIDLKRVTKIEHQPGPTPRRPFPVEPVSPLPVIEAPAEPGPWLEPVPPEVALQPEFPKVEGVMTEETKETAAVSPMLKAPESKDYMSSVRGYINLARQTTFKAAKTAKEYNEAVDGAKQLLQIQEKTASDQRAARLREVEQAYQKTKKEMDELYSEGIAMLKTGQEYVQTAAQFVRAEDFTEAQPSAVKLPSAPDISPEDARRRALARAKESLENLVETVKQLSEEKKMEQQLALEQQEKRLSENVRGLKQSIEEKDSQLSSERKRRRASDITIFLLVVTLVLLLWVWLKPFLFQ